MQRFKCPADFAGEFAHRTLGRPLNSRRVFEPFILCLLICGATPSTGAELPPPYQIRLGDPRGARLAGPASTNAVWGTAITTSQMAPDQPDSPTGADPLEPVNRVTFAVNLKADQWVIKPVAQAYQTVTPTPVRSAIRNMFGNIADLWTSANNAMQGKFPEARTDATRFLINSSVGVAGLMDFASDWGYHKHKEDFGQTLGVWGVPPGPYIVLPLLGPSTLRDSVALVGVDHHASPFRYLADPGARNAVSAVRLTDSRARLLDREKALQGIAIDQYLFVRDAYLQRRQSQVTDGHGPED
ncbi:MAG: VacJ family lipoprotein [Betaproteobacteria bacterium]|nr:VacJ family lipoprotein [Betaproteobacteria bacterium]